MINLLPPEEKEVLLLDKKKKIIIILWFLVLFFLLCLILVLFSTKVYLQIQAESQKNLLNETKEEIGKTEFQNFQEKVYSINLTLTKLDSFYREKVYFSEVFSKISEILPQEMYLTNFSANSISDKEREYIRISLSGFAPTAEKLQEFRKNLKEESGFKNSNFPLSNWEKLTDIDFYVTFEI